MDLLKVLADRGDFGNARTVVELEGRTGAVRILCQIGGLAVLAGHDVDIFERDLDPFSAMNMRTTWGLGPMEL